MNEKSQSTYEQKKDFNSIILMMGILGEKIDHLRQIAQDMDKHLTESISSLTLAISRLKLNSNNKGE